ncbi:hypothetical protein ACEXQD_18745 [Herbiconiux sp. P15]|uniref:hypothetical protein n=1 Tax=Herbiconiux liukaitaii TaxID=3342799 RepID=UPI0035BAE415
MSQPPVDPTSSGQQPGYGQPPQFQPPQGPPQPQYQPPQYQPPQQQPPYQAPQYRPQQPGQQPGYGQQPGQQQPGQQQQYPGYGQQPQKAASTRNPLAFASLILGVIPTVLGLLFLLVQAALLSSGGSDAYGAISGVQLTLQALLGIAALVLGILALVRPGSGKSKAMAGAGTALGGALLVNVLSSVLYPIVINAFYGF